VVTGGHCIKKTVDIGTSGESAVAGVLANNGTPFYIMAILVVIAGAIGHAVYSSKKAYPDVLLMKDWEHVLYFMMNAAGILGELILGIAILSSGAKHLIGFGALMLASRVAVGVTPGVIVFHSIFCGSDQDALVDAKTGEKRLRYYIDTDAILKNSKLYLGLILMSVLEPTLLAFMPWYSTEMSRATKYPTLSFLKVNYFFEILQLSVTLAAQLGITLSTEGQGTKTFTAIVVMNVAYSSLMLCLKIVDMYLKWSLLRGAAKSEDCPSAQEAWKKAGGTVGAGAGTTGDKDSGADNGDASSSSLEMGTLHARQGAAGSSMSASVRDSNDGGTLTANPMHHVTPTIAARSGGGGPAWSSGDAATASSSSNSQKEAASSPSLQEAADLLSAELGLAREEGESTADLILKAALELNVDTEGKKTKAIATACLAEI
jgi:hypothetical protein